MPDLKTILDIVRHNEEIARKFFEIEKRILVILDFAGLFEVLVAEIRSQFKVPYAWISLVGKSELTGFIRKLTASEKLKKHLNLVEKSVFESLTHGRMKPILANGDLKRFSPLFPKNPKHPIRSVAIAPIALDGELIGSLNQADTSSERFHPGIDVSLLEQLAMKVSLCLSNVTAHEKLQYLAFHDALTGLLNRRVMDSILEREFTRAWRYGTRLSLVFLDLNDFKAVNDHYGHDLGDALLAYVARNLSDFCRKIDVVARYAGDEFILLLPETGEKETRRLMERICAHFADHPFQNLQDVIPVSISYGISSVGDVGVEDARSLLKKADEALYVAKHARKTASHSEMQGMPKYKGMAL